MGDRDAINTQSEDKAIVECLMTKKDNYLACFDCGKAGLEGRHGADEQAGQFFCGRCLWARDPKVQAGKEEDEAEELDGKDTEAEQLLQKLMGTGWSADDPA